MKQMMGKSEMTRRASWLYALLKALPLLCGVDTQPHMDFSLFFFRTGPPLWHLCIWRWWNHWNCHGWGLWRMQWGQIPYRVDFIPPKLWWNEGLLTTKTVQVQDRNVGGRDTPLASSCVDFSDESEVASARSAGDEKFSWASGNCPSCLSPREAWPLNACFKGHRLNSWRSTLPFLRIKYCYYNENSRDSLASVLIQTARSNSAVHSTQLTASSTKHLSLGAHQHGVSFEPRWLMFKTL